jgi:hypothetical protein
MKINWQIIQTFEFLKNKRSNIYASFNQQKVDIVKNKTKID